MLKRSLAAAAIVAGAALWSGAALAAPGTATGNVNMRSGPSTQYGVVTTIPAGAPVEVYGCQSWCQIGYAGRQGYVSSNYIASGYAQAPRYRAAPVYRPPVVQYYQPRPAYYGGGYGYYRDRDYDYRPYRPYRPYRGYDRGYDGFGGGSGIYFEFGR